MTVPHPLNVPSTTPDNLISKDAARQRQLEHLRQTIDNSLDLQGTRRVDVTLRLTCDTTQPYALLHILKDAMARMMADHPVELDCNVSLNATAAFDNTPF